MDWNLAIERNREALKRIVAMLVAMAGLGNGHSAIAGRQSESEPAQAADGSGYSRLPIADCRTAAYCCPAISTAQSCACCVRPSPPRGGSSSSWRADLSWRCRRCARARPNRRRSSCASPSAPAFISRRAPALRRPPPLWGGVRVAVRPRARTSLSLFDPLGRFAPGRSGPSRTAFPASRFRASPRRLPLRRAVRQRPTIRSTRPASRSASRRWARRWTTCRDTQSASRAGRLPATPQARRIKKPAMPQARKAEHSTPAAFAASGRCVRAVRPANVPPIDARTRCTKSCTTSTASPSTSWSIPTRRDGLILPCEAGDATRRTDGRGLEWAAHAFARHRPTPLAPLFPKEQNDAIRKPTASRRRDMSADTIEHSRPRPRPHGRHHRSRERHRPGRPQDASRALA